jgi:hypothetical protein
MLKYYPKQKRLLSRRRWLMKPLKRRKRERNKKLNKKQLRKNLRLKKVNVKRLRSLNNWRYKRQLRN